MKKLILSLLSIVLLGSMSSCGFYSHLTGNQNQNQTSVVLKEANYRIVENISSEVSQTYIFGMGGLRKQALRENAIDKMLNEARQKNPGLMSGSKAIINITTSENVRMITPIYIKRTIMAHGAVIEFTK